MHTKEYILEKQGFVKGVMYDKFTNIVVFTKGGQMFGDGRKFIHWKGYNNTINALSPLLTMHI